MSQLQQDLEALLSEVDAGWDNGCRNPRMRAGRPAYVEFGAGGCLLDQMHRVQDAQGLRRGLDGHERQDRRDAMRLALGFKQPHEMFDWNNSQTDPNEIKLRIKDALNNLQA